MRNPSLNKKIFFTIPAIIILVGIIFCVAITPKGFNLGIDFKGGTEFEIDIDREYTPEIEGQIRTIISDCTNQSNGVQIRTAGEGDNQTILVTMLELTNEQGTAVRKALSENFSIDSNKIQLDQVGQTVSQKLVANAIYSILIAVALMLLYIWIRFDLQSGSAAVLALCHDVLIMFSYYAIFRNPINTSFIAAILTIVGYSINATIVVFDRVRENGKKMRKASFTEIADTSIRQSYGRAINSSLTTLFTIGSLFIFGVSDIREFALPIIIGLVAGTYSSLFISAPFWAFWKESAKKSNAR